ncbi:MAG: hypothetical protein C0417_02450 [Chlorobiaceae bacterium]|nr:hypothetical protein [Chlorobiaceae bacterium]
MNIRFYHWLWLAFAAITLTTFMTRAQLTSEIRLTGTGYYATSALLHRMVFGNHINATFCIDSLNPTFIERECPPDICDFVWKNIPGRINCFGGGLMYYDIRSIPPNNAQKDTFFLGFGETPFTPEYSKWVFRWPDSSYLRERCDSMFLVGAGNLQGTNINMFKTDSLELNIPIDSHPYFGAFYIYKYGCKIIDDIESVYSSAPTNFSLHQNYPNPFNPTTSIKYQLPFNSQVKLKIYTVLGQQVALLTDEIQQAGIKSATWNANDAASGVYFYKLEAVSVSDPSKTFTQVKKMLLVK